MLSIQELGLQILQHNPLKFYIFGGSEYGIKMRYIDELKKYYGECIESPDVESLISMMSVRHIIPLKPTVYVVRYDEDFVKAMSDAMAKKIKSTKIIGTIVCIYEDRTKVEKFNKYLPEYTASIDTVAPHFLVKYLQSDFPTLDEKYAKIAVGLSTDYNQAKNICRALSYATPELLAKTNENDILRLIGYIHKSNDEEAMIYIASKSFAGLIQIMQDQVNASTSSSDDVYGSLIYQICTTMVELDKLLDNSHRSSPIQKQVRNWTRADVYYMFNHAYDGLLKIRSVSVDPENILIYLFGLLKFQRIPSLGDMK